MDSLGRPGVPLNPLSFCLLILSPLSIKPLSVSWVTIGPRTGGSDYLSSGMGYLDITAHFPTYLDSQLMGRYQKFREGSGSVRHLLSPSPDA